MILISDCNLKAGGDPRQLPDSIALSNEFSKLAHPARPDVDWYRIETHCLQLLKLNGIDLQTAAWYTIARMHIAGLLGMNEGLKLVNALLANHWSVMWPNHARSRAEIIYELHQQLQKVFRTLALREADDLPILYQAEQNLMRLTEIVSHHEINPVCRPVSLQQQIKLAITRLENALPNVKIGPTFKRPLRPEPEETVVTEYPFFVAEPESEVNGATITPTDRKRMGTLILGFLCALLVSVILFWY